MLQYRKLVLLAVVLLFSASVKACEDESVEDYECGENEEFVETDRGERTCFNRDPDPCEPVEECRCISGYVRHKGVCIPEDECPPKCGKHIRDCECDRRCKDPNAELVVTMEGKKRCCGNDPPLCEQVEECRCRKGYLLHSGKCVRKCDCPKCKDPNEEYIMTMEGERTCYGKFPDLVEKFDGCRCKNGYVRHEGRCIRECDCPKCADPNAEYVKTMEGKKRCCGNDPPLCKPVKECRCKKGYLLHSGKCVRACDCPTCKDPNEVYTMTMRGEKTCYGREPDHSDIVDGCFCKDGYVRHKGKCIKECHCPRECKKYF